MKLQTKLKMKTKIWAKVLRTKMSPNGLYTLHYTMYAHYSSVWAILYGHIHGNWFGILMRHTCSSRQLPVASCQLPTNSRQLSAPSVYNWYANSIDETNPKKNTHRKRCPLEIKGVISIYFRKCIRAQRSNDHHIIIVMLIICVTQFLCLLRSGSPLTCEQVNGGRVASPRSRYAN